MSEYMQIRADQHYKNWCNQFAIREGTTTAELVDRALTAYATAQMFTPPPARNSATCRSCGGELPAGFCGSARICATCRREQSVQKALSILRAAGIKAEMSGEPPPPV